jgi:hypothetical protein
MNWTDQGVKNFRDSVDRADTAEVALSPAGIKFKDLYWTVGAYDLIATPLTRKRSPLRCSRWQRRATCGRRHCERSRPTR